MVIIKFGFDINGNYETPTIVLCNPDKSELGILEQIDGINIIPRFNSISEITFTIYNTNIYYEKVVKNRLINVIGFGYFIIRNTDTKTDGGTDEKNITCYSYEYKLNYKGVNIVPTSTGGNKTYAFYNPIVPEESLMHELFSVVKDWKIGYVSPNLYSKYRTFEASEEGLYGFLMEDVSKSYEVIFEFDTENLLVNAYEPTEIVKNTDIILTFDNLLKEVTLNELEDDIITVLNVSGADNLSISTVNPLGDKKLYDFSYYLNEDWISDKNLIEKVKNWDVLIESYRDSYTENLNELKILNRDLLLLKTQRQDLVSEKESLELVRKTIDSLIYPTEFKNKTNEINAVESEIILKDKEISNKNLKISNVDTALKNINDSVKYTKYFTEIEQELLEPYIIEGEYVDGNFIVTDAMVLPENADSEDYIITTTGTKKIKNLTSSDIIIDEQYIADQLLEQGKTVIKTMSQPSYSFDIDCHNFLFIEKFQEFQRQAVLGGVINIEVSENNWMYPMLLEMNIDYDNPSSFSMTFGNRFRLSSEEWTFSDLHNEQIKTSNKVSTTLSMVSEPVLNGKINEVENFINGNLNASLNQITSTSDNEFTISGQGLMGRKISNAQGAVNGYDPHQLWINNELIVMSDDAWQSAKLAIGYIGGAGNGYYGVNAEVIAGDLIAGKQLNITNDSGSFKVDSTKVSITNLELELTKDSNKIVMNPNVGLQFYKGSTKPFDLNLTTGNVIIRDLDLEIIKGLNKIIINPNVGLQMYKDSTKTFDLNLTTGDVESIGVFKSLSNNKNGFSQLDRNGIFVQNASGTNKRGIYTATNADIVGSLDSLLITKPDTSGNNTFGEIRAFITLFKDRYHTPPVLRMLDSSNKRVIELGEDYNKESSSYINMYENGNINMILDSTIPSISGNPYFVNNLRVHSAIFNSLVEKNMLWTTTQNQIVLETDWISTLGRIFKTEWYWSSDLGKWILTGY